MEKVSAGKYFFLVKDGTQNAMPIATGVVLRKH